MRSITLQEIFNVTSHEGFFGLLHYLKFGFAFFAVLHVLRVTMIWFYRPFFF